MMTASDKKNVTLRYSTNAYCWERKIIKLNMFMFLWLPTT